MTQITDFKAIKAVNWVLANSLLFMALKAPRQPCTVEPHLSDPHLSNLLSQPTNPPPQNMYIFSLFCKVQYEKFYIIMALMVFLLSFNAFLQVKEGI